jgi:Ni,Fe-hydrogenase maturation factor
MRVLLGGVGELFQGDLDVGRLAAERLASGPQPLGRAGLEVLVEELHYGAVAVAQRFEELRPTAVVLFGAVSRGTTPGTVRRRRVDKLSLSAADLQAAVGDAVTGYVGIDLVVEVAGGLGLLPSRTVVVELEPARVGPGEGLSEEATRGLEAVVRQVRREVARVPVLELADDLRRRRAEQSGDVSGAGIAMDRLLDALEHVDREGRWAQTFQCRDRLRAAMGRGDTGEVMDRRDWALWWALVEELDAVQKLEVASESG